MKLNFKRQEKNKKRFNVYSGDEYLFSVSEYTFINENLYDGIEIEDMEAFKKRCVEKEHYNYCLDILSRNSYTIKTVADKLSLRDCPPDTAEKIIKKLCENGYLSDEDYKERYIFSQQTYKKAGHRKIKQELYLKGITVTDEDFDKEEEKKNLKILVEGLIKRNTETKKIINRLLSKGYDFSDIKEAIENFKECEYYYEED